MNHYDAFRLSRVSSGSEEDNLHTRKQFQSSRKRKLSLEAQSKSNSQRQQIVIQYRVSIQMNHYDAFRLDQESHQAVKKIICIRENNSNQAERENSLSKLNRNRILKGSR